MMRPLSWDDADSGALFRPSVGRIGEPCPTLIIGFMVGMMRPLIRDDADSGAPMIEPVHRICESRPGLIIGLMVGMMRPLSRAFAGPLILDPSVRWLALSPARDAPGRDSARWLISRTGSGRRHMEWQPGELRDEARATRKESAVPDARIRPNRGHLAGILVDD